MHAGSGPQRADNAQEECRSNRPKILSKELFPVHGHYINGQVAKDMGLQVELLDKDDPLWKLIWDYYMRCEVQMNIPLQPPQIKTKLFESGNQISLVVQDMP